MYRLLTVFAAASAVASRQVRNSTNGAPRWSAAAAPTAASAPSKWWWTEPPRSRSAAIRVPSGISRAARRSGAASSATRRCRATPPISALPASMAAAGSNWSAIRATAASPSSALKIPRAAPKATPSTSSGAAVTTVARTRPWPLPRLLAAIAFRIVIVQPPLHHRAGRQCLPGFGPPAGREGDRFRGRRVEFLNTRIDDNPGRNDWVVGVIDVFRGRDGWDGRYRFSCSVNFDSGQVRSVEIDSRRYDRNWRDYDRH